MMGRENFRLVSGVGSASLELLLFESLNLVSVLWNFGLTLGEDSSGEAELKKKHTACIKNKTKQHNKTKTNRETNKKRDKQTKEKQANKIELQ